MSLLLEGSHFFLIYNENRDLPRFVLYSNSIWHYLSQKPADVFERYNTYNVSTYQIALNIIYYCDHKFLLIDELQLFKPKGNEK